MYKDYDDYLGYQNEDEEITPEDVIQSDLDRALAKYERSQDE